MLRARFLDFGGGGGKKKNNNNKSNTKVLIGSCSEYEFPSLSVGVSKVHNQDGGVHEGNNVLRDGPWMIRGVPIFLHKWSPSVSLLEEELSCVPVWVKFHNVSLVAYTLDGLSLIAMKIGPRYTKETIRVEYEWEPPRCGTCLIFGHSVDGCPKAPKRVVNRVDKGNGGSSGVDDEGFIEVKKKKSCGNNGGTKNFKLISMKPKTQYRPRVNQLTEGVSPKTTYSKKCLDISNSFEALNVDDSVTEEVESDGKCVLMNDDGNPLVKVDYSGDHDGDDEVEPVDNEMTSYLASKSSGLDMGFTYILETEFRVFYLLALEKGRYAVSKGFNTAYWLVLGVNQSIIYNVYAYVDTAYSSKSGNGLEFVYVLGYAVFV
nr:hypothetical protein [Tanacetum cinerariifolium]